jgi:hydroxymethylpyrimidine/phosphomethylpyrimidine kinase
MKRAAESIRLLGARTVLVKGGHRRHATDILLDETGQFTEFRAEYIDVGEIHGSGCTLSAAIAANLGLGLSLDAAVAAAKNYLTEAIHRLRRVT